MFLKISQNSQENTCATVKVYRIPLVADSDHDILLQKLYIIGSSKQLVNWFLSYPIIMLCDGMFAWLSVVVVAHALYGTYGPPCRQCLDIAEFEFYSGRLWIPASLFDADRYIKKNLWFVHKYSFLWCSWIPYTYMDVQRQHEWSFYRDFF